MLYPATIGDGMRTPQWWLSMSALAALIEVWALLLGQGETKTVTLFLSISGLVVATIATVISVISFWNNRRITYDLRFASDLNGQSLKHYMVTAGTHEGNVDNSSAVPVMLIIKRPVKDIQRITFRLVRRHWGCRCWGLWRWEAVRSRRVEVTVIWDVEEEEALQRLRRGAVSMVFPPHPHRQEDGHGGACLVWPGGPGWDFLAGESKRYRLAIIARGAAREVWKGYLEFEGPSADGKVECLRRRLEVVSHGP